jgi:hydrogenase maturation protease
VHLVRDALPEAAGGPGVRAGIAILGVGSPFGDDRAGWLAVEAVRASDWFRSLPADTVRAEALDRPGVGLLDAMAGVRHAILIDAAVSGLPLGTVREVTLAELQSGEGTCASSHGFGVADALALAETLGQLPPRVTLLVVEAGPGNAAAPAPEVQAAVPELVRRIVACVEQDAIAGA